MRITLEPYKGGWRMLLDQQPVATLIDRQALVALETYLATVDLRGATCDACRRVGGRCPQPASQILNERCSEVLL